MKQRAVREGDGWRRGAIERLQYNDDVRLDRVTAVETAFILRCLD